MSDNSADVRALIELEVPLRIALTRLRDDPFGSSLSAPCLIDRTHVRRAAQKLLDGELSEAEVREWAEALEIRDDVLPGGQSEAEKSFVATALFWLATPELAGMDTQSLARDLIRQIDDSTAQGR